jgi:hypothetical protein
MSVDAMVPLVRSALAVSSSYDDEKIPDLIRRTINRLLRDYHFPKSVVRTTIVGLTAGDQHFTLPVGFKKELGVRLYNPVDKSWTEPLGKRNEFRLPYPSKQPRHYWLEGSELWIDTPISVEMAGLSAVIWHETMDADSNETWITAEYPDAVMYLSIVRGAAEFRKPDIVPVYAELWKDEQQSLAIYLNELEWDKVEMYQREAVGYPSDRYPRS